MTEFPPCSTNTRMFRSRVVVFRTNFVKNKHLEVDLMYIPTLLFIQYSSIDYLHRTKATLSLSCRADSWKEVRTQAWPRGTRGKRERLSLAYSKSAPTLETRNCVVEFPF